MVFVQKRDAIQYALARREHAREDAGLSSVLLYRPETSARVGETCQKTSEGFASRIARTVHDHRLDGFADPSAVSVARIARRFELTLDEMSSTAVLGANR